MQIATIVGARPQFIKAATVSRAISAHNARIPSDPRLTNTHSPLTNNYSQITNNYSQITNNHSPITETLIHTGQHFDAGMSDIFFKELGIPEPDHHLGVSGGGHGAMTGVMLEKLEPLLQDIAPDCVLVYGDTNSTLAGALAAAKLHIPVAHVEAGLRSYNRRMPEEINRIVTDQLSTILFCPTETAVKNLHKEGFPHQISTNHHSPITNNDSRITDNRQLITQCGDVMFDAALFYAKRAEGGSGILAANSLEPKKYVLATVHRAENTDDPARLKAIFDSLHGVAREMPVVLPLHPRTKKQLELLDSQLITHYSSHITFIDPVGYLDMVALETSAAVIATDSGGVQKEAYFHGVPCVTLRDETEWSELVEAGWNRLAVPGSSDVLNVILASVGSRGRDIRPYGEGRAAELIVEKLVDLF
jgi:UDP-GlcNAc3NAcA epimerase